MTGPSSPFDAIPELTSGLDALRIGLVMVDGADVISYANDHFGFLFPDQASPIGQPVDAFIDALAPLFRDDADLWRARRREAGPGEPFDLLLLDGRIIEVKERPLPDEAGSVLLWSNATELRRQTARLEDVIEASSEGFAFFGPDGGLDLWNDGFTIALGGDDGLKRGASLGALLAKARACGRVSIVGDPPPMDSVASAPRRRDFLLTHKDGRFLRLRARPSRSGGMVAVVTDLTAERAQGDALAQRGAALAEATAALRESRWRLRMQTASLLGLKEELFRAQRDADDADLAKQAFLRTMSHELRTPLNSIIGFAEIVGAELYGPVGAPQYAEYAGLIRESGKRLLRIINRILDITRLESGVAQLSVDAEDLGVLAQRAAEKYADAAAEAGVAITLAIAKDTPKALADEGAIRTILENLLDNALAHTEPGGVVTLSTAVIDDAHIALTVSDTGAGIAPQDLDRVMLPFEQAGTSSEREGEGCGLGLPIVKALAEALGGAFEITSALGRGTDAVVTFRTAASDAATASESDAA